MSDLKRLNLKGAVRAVVMSEQVFSGQRRTEEWEFDQDGLCVRRTHRSAGQHSTTELRRGPKDVSLYPGEEIVEHQDESYLKIESLPPGIDGWSLPYLPQVMFPTGGARVVKTAFDAEGTPIMSVFGDQADEEIATIRYSAERHGLITEAIQRIGSAAPTASIGAADLETDANEYAIPIHLGRGAEQMRVQCTYDSAARMDRCEVSMFGSRRRVETYEHNDQGDVVGIQVNDRPKVRFEYVYDQRGNWIRRQTYHSLGVDEQERQITYYND